MKCRPFIDGLYTGDAGELANNPQLLIAIEIVTDIVVVRLPFTGLKRILHEYRDCYCCASASAKDVAAFHAPLLALRPCISAKIENVDARELFTETPPKPIKNISVDKRAVCHETNDTSFFDAVTRP